MISMKKQMAVAVAVWVAAVGSAAALTYYVNPPVHRLGAASLRAGPLRQANAATTDPALDEERVLRIPNLTIFAPFPHRSATPSAFKLPEISEMNCSDWRSLDMGSGRVQTCE